MTYVFVVVAALSVCSSAFAASMVKCADGTFTNTGCPGAVVRDPAPAAIPRPSSTEFVCRPGDWACLSAVQGAQNRRSAAEEREWLDSRRAVEREAAQREAEKRYQRQLMDEARRGR